MKRSKSWLAVVTVLLLAAAAGSATAQTVTKFLVSPLVIRLDAGSSSQIVVELLDEQSRSIPIETAGVQFTSSDTSVVSVGSQGAVRALKAGRAEIVVRAGGQARRVPVTVSGTAAPVSVAAPEQTRPPVQLPANQPPVPAAQAGPVVVAGTILPIKIQLLPGERFRPTFRLIFADGTQSDTKDVVWTTFGAAVSVSSNDAGEIIGVAAGTGTLGGSYGKSTTASVPVAVAEPTLVPQPDSLRMVSGAQDTVVLVVPEQGRRVVTQNLIWRSTNPAVVRVLSPTAGVVQSLDAGEANLIVDGYGVTRAIPVRVTPRIAKVETIPAQGATVTVGTGGTITLEAKAFGTTGTQLSNAALSWSVADTTVARIDARGVVTGLREGTTRVTLDPAGLPLMTWPLTVQAARVSFASHSVAIIAGTTRKFGAQIRGSDNRDFGPAMAVRWVSSAPDLVSVDASGNLTAHKPGRTTVIGAQTGAGADTVSVYVTGRGLVSGSIGGVRGIWQLVGAKDTTPMLLAQLDSGQATQAVWSPDRTKIAFTYEPLDRTNLPRVMMIDADGANRTTLSPDTLSASDPSWTKDGKAVLMASRDPKLSAIMRVQIDTHAMTVVASAASAKFRYPIAENDTGSVLIRVENGGVADLARLKAGTVLQLTNGKPREELITQLRDGRVLLAVDSSSRARPSTLQWVSISGDQAQTPTPVRIPGGLIIQDISRGYDDNSIIVVARARSWPGASGAALVILRIALDGAEPQQVMVLGEKDFVTVRTD